jgi:hypothetical protein
MKRIFFLLLFLSTKIFSQSYLIEDIDGDNLKDSIYTSNESIIHKLSSKNYHPISIDLIENYGGSFKILKTRNGFQYEINYRKAGIKAQFRYNPSSENIALIGMSRYEFGNASNDGSGESSVNILTNDYIGNWKYYDVDKETLVALPTIKTKMILPKISLREFNEQYLDTYVMKCSEVYQEYKNQYLRISKKDKEYNVHIKKTEKDIDFKRVSFNEIPKFIKYEGKLKNVISWKDINGEHYIVTSETGIYTPENSEDYGSNAEIFAYHYLLKNDISKKIWKIYDFIKECPVEIEASFLKNTLHITDLDDNGINEVWIMYRKVCHGDVSPLEMKIIMYEGDQKYAIRGHNKVKIASDKYYGGEYRYDLQFMTAPASFRAFGQNLWNENILHEWGE